MATRLLENKTDEKQLIKLAQKRVKLPVGWLEMEYRNESDLLLIRCSRNKAARSRGDVSNGLVYNYDTGGNLVSIEVIDLYGIYDTV